MIGGINSHNVDVFAAAQYAKKINDGGDGVGCECDCKGGHVV
jgi:hypothetical protein